MATIILGHGGFDPTHNPPEVLIPPGIVLNTYSDTGEVLWVPAQWLPDGTRGFNYSNLASVWDHYRPYASMTERMVVPNFSLGQLKPLEIELANGLDWGGAVALCVGDAIEDNFPLCNGTEETCPTAVLLVEESEDPGSVDPNRWYHGCDGVLGSWGQQTDGDIHWIACTSIDAIDVEPGIEGDRNLADAAP